MANKNIEPIAVIGIGAIMPKALNKETFWQNILEGKNCITEVPPATHWDPALFYSPDHKAEDKTYSKIGGFIEGFQFNSLKYRIPPQVAKQMDSVQHLAIETTAMALADSGYDQKPFDRARTAVIIGNAMGGMKQEMSNTRANKEYFYEIIKKTPYFQNLPAAQQQAVLAEIEAGVKDKFLPITEDTMPGELANVIAGRVANVFDVNGTNFTVDAACATSLAAIDQAVNGLRMNNYDMVICGGVDQMMSASAYIKFSKIGALSAEGSCPFDKKANGFVMAEGSGVVILKRLSDAVKDGDKIYSVIRAIGASSDGKGKGITAPNPKGQKIAVEKTFEQLDYGPADIGLMEAHGTSTAVGDKVEVNALNEVFAEAKPGSIALGSIKSQIGHAKAAAGIASFIKAALALYNKVLPPSINFTEPNPAVDWATSPFKVQTKTEEWKSDRVRRANVSSFGFGGTNFHVALEEFHPALEEKVKQNAYSNCSVKETAAPVSAVQSAAVKETTNMDSSKYNLMVDPIKLEGEMLTFSGDTKQELFSDLANALKLNEADSMYIPKAAYLNHTRAHKKFAVVINAETPAKLKEKIEFFIKTAGTHDVWAQELLHLRIKGIYPFHPSTHTPKVAFMFPGQGSQYVDMMKDLASKYKVVKDTFDEADRVLKGMIGTTLTEVIWSKEGESKEEYAKRENAIKQTQMTQPAVMTADVAMMRLLSSFNIRPEVVMGHSLGEYAAAVAAGVFDFENGLKSVTIRGMTMSNVKVEDPGGMASIAAPVEKVKPELSKISGYIDVANKNCPTQTVIAGETKSIAQAIKMFNDMGIQAVNVPVSHAFHSKIIEPAEDAYREFLNTLEVHVPKIPITSNVTADFYPADTNKIKDLLVEQLVSSVEWIEQLKRTYDSGVRLFVECGPKRVLSAFATSTLDDKKDIKVMASNHPKKGGITEFNDLLANLTASGIPLDWTGTDANGDSSVLNPAYTRWVRGEENIQGSVVSNMNTNVTAAAPAASAAGNCNNTSVAISGIAAGGPGSFEKVFREGVLDEILQGKNMIESISAEQIQEQIDKNVEFLIKAKDGNNRLEKLDNPSKAIKLNARAGHFDLEKEFGLPAKWVSSMDRNVKLAIAAGILALKDAGIPLVSYYKPTSTGGYLPDRWGLPAEMIDTTGVIFTTAFPNINAVVEEISTVVESEIKEKSREDIYNFYLNIISKLTDANIKREVSEWFAVNFAKYGAGEKRKVFAQDFLLKVLPIAHAHLAQWIRARGPATSLSGACASTAQAVCIAQDWIRLGRAKRVIIISGDDETNEVTGPWLSAAFLASGAATTEGDVTKAALPFDRRRNGMIVGMGAIGMIVEAEEEILKRGMKPLARILETEMRNSAFHPTRLDVNHVSEVMDQMITKAEKDYGLNRADISKNLIFISHETYTPARGGSASAEANALKVTFGPNVSNVIVSNTKGFTGHSMGAGLEDVIAVRALNTGIVPPIANFREADPELEGINLSKGGKYDFKYALRLAAGFGSQLSMTLTEKTWSVTEPRIFDNNAYSAFLQRSSGQSSPVLETVDNTLRVKDSYIPGQKPSLVMEGSQAFVDKVKGAVSHTAKASVAAAPAPAAQPQPAAAPAPVAAPAQKLDEATVKADLLKLISEKTGYPQDMLDPDLDMEADLGIDTVKQAELFASIREIYSIPVQEGLQLKDYPTINHMVGFVINNAGGAGSSAPAAPVAQPQPAAAPAPVAAPAAQSAAVAAPAQKLDESAVKADLLSLISEKTGYPQDMLDPELDMEADLGIDTVKQAELFASIREKYGMPVQEGLQLKDYPTINHMVGFVINNAGGSACSVAAPAAQQPAAVSAPVAQPQPAAAPAPVAAPAPAPAVSAAPAASLDEETVKTELLNLISEKTGYPQDMLDLDLDMEADLGIDTVKQAELFASIREKYNIPVQEGLQLKDYPTIRHMIGFVTNNAGGASSAAAPAAVQPSAAPAPVAQPQPVVTPSAPASQPVVAATPAASGGDLNEENVKNDLINLISEKTGYPQDMLDLDLDMEADLGIDTVKQAELFASIREKYNIPVQEGLQLKDYPTIRHIIGFVMQGGVSGAEEASAPAQTPAPAALAAQPEQAVTPAVTEAPVAAPEIVPAQTQDKPYKGENAHEKKLRYVPTLVDAPLTETMDRKLSPNRTVLIFADNSQLIKAYTEELNGLGIKTHVFTTLKARSKNTTIVNWDSLEETENVLREYQKENAGNTQGIIYLLGCTLKKFDKKNNPHNELTKHVMPLFMACKVFETDLADRKDADTFIATAIKADGSFGYATDEAINPTIGSLSGSVQCFRKDMFEVAGVFSKFMDFEPETEPKDMAKQMMHEVLKGDMRFMISYKDGKRSTILSLPIRLDKSEKRFDLAGKTVVFTGAGRGIGAMLSQKIAEQYKSKIIVLDIIEIHEKTPVWASMNAAELDALKKQIWAELKSNPDIKPTPVLLEREFGKVTDSISLYKNLEILRKFGSEVEYYQCDVTNSTMMKDVATKIKAKNGKVDGLVHFAGLERSKLVRDKTSEEFYRIFDVKAVSAAAFLALNLVKDTGFYGFASSIAGKYGNLGQSDYGAANDYLSKLSISLQNQGMRSIAVCMSAFKNVGMGVRAGVETFLKSNGVDFVDPEDGMQMFLDEIVYGRVPEIVLTDVLGKLDWDRQVKTDWEEIGEDGGVETRDANHGGSGSGGQGGGSSSPAVSPDKAYNEEGLELKENHFLGNIVELVPGKKIFCEKEFTMESDPYLKDHSIEGTPYVPGVMGLETFTEAATAMMEQKPDALEDVHFYLPIKLLRLRPQAVRIKGEMEGTQGTFVIESDFINSKGVKMGNTRKHFTARTSSNTDSKWNSVKGTINLDTSKVVITKSEIYKRYFHGPSFQVMDKIFYTGEKNTLALYKRPAEKLFEDGPRKLSAYPMLIEAAFQSCGYRDLVMDNRMTLPDSIGKVIIHGKGQAPEELYLYSIFTGLTIDGKSIHDAYAFDKDMNIWIELQDYQAIGQ
ncbi:malonyl CoA-acyl carrier protein transacylase [Parelusimicrobium proximum]|uniref:SDR family NAD(P)-dependent oxidoreductase n=1 Tax=Parelusimicrobium proximum TaxID=3228953 RepID=UPI003D16C3AA